jgi:microcystin-dependent protein
MTGQGLPHDNMQPTQALVWCIAYAGIFPSFSNS